jgi:hypothetical protein
MEALPQCLQRSLICADAFLISITPAAEVVAAQPQGRAIGAIARGRRRPRPESRRCCLADVSRCAPPLDQRCRVVDGSADCLTQIP